MRRIQIPSTYTFWDLHCAIQDSFGWTDTHLHEFRLVLPVLDREARFGIPFEDFGQEPAIPCWKIKVADMLIALRARFHYLYDFGDGWLHIVELEKLLPCEEGVSYPRCIGGRRRCPPEDCGGIYMYSELLKILADPGHPEYAEKVAWCGGVFDPAEFSVGEVEFMDPREELRIRLEELSD